MRSSCPRSGLHRGAVHTSRAPPATPRRGVALHGPGRAARRARRSARHSARRGPSSRVAAGRPLVALSRSSRRDPAPAAVQGPGSSAKAALGASTRPAQVLELAQVEGEAAAAFMRQLLVSVSTDL